MPTDLIGRSLVIGDYLLSNCAGMDGINLLTISKITEVTKTYIYMIVVYNSSEDSFPTSSEFYLPNGRKSVQEKQDDWDLNWEPPTCGVGFKFKVKREDFEEGVPRGEMFLANETFNALESLMIKQSIKDTFNG
jgi:hypothetical protein